MHTQHSIQQCNKGEFSIKCLQTSYFLHLRTYALRLWSLLHRIFFLRQIKSARSQKKLKSVCVRRSFGEDFANPNAFSDSIGSDKYWTYFASASLFNLNCGHKWIAWRKWYRIRSDSANRELRSINLWSKANEFSDQWRKLRENHVRNHCNLSFI